MSASDWKPRERLVVYVDADVKRRVRSEAEEIGVTMSDYVRMSLAAFQDMTECGRGEESPEFGEI